MNNQEEFKEVVLSEEEFKLLDLESLPLWSPYSSDDPRSPFYKRVLAKPELRWKHIVAYTILFLIVQCLTFGITFYLQNNVILSVLAVVIISILFIFLFRRKIAIGIIKLYQFFAPTSLRERCMFEPSCSQYMIAAINKYGTLHGIAKGINRLRRCNSKGGGFDYP